MYNSLNLPSQVKENGTVKATYQYTANGTKLSVRSNGNSGYDYEGSFVFTVTNNTSVLEAAHFPEGQLKASGVNYALTDHLGSTRAMVDANGTVQQQNDYYSFGSQHVNVSYADNDNRYTFSGKEQQDLLDLNMYDFGARMYDSDIARWGTIDPFAEKWPSIGTYAYCINSPLLLIDLYGLAWFWHSPDGVSDPQWIWHEGNTYDTGMKDQNGNPFMLKGQEAVVEFVGSHNEKLGDGNILGGEGGISADVTLYAPDGSIQHLLGYSMTSNAEKYTPIDDGIYTVSRREGAGSGQIPKHYQLFEKGKDNIRTLDGQINQNAPGQIREDGTGYKTGIFYPFNFTSK